MKDDSWSTPEMTFPASWERTIAASPTGTVASLVGDGFARIARVLNPAYRIDQDRRSAVPWSEIAARGGRDIDLAASSFRDVSGTTLHSGATGPNWDTEPSVGGDVHVLLELVRVLRKFAADPSAVSLAVWTGFASLRETPGSPLIIGNRKYLATRGPIIGLLDPAGEGIPANVGWDEDAGWLVVSDIDLPATYVAGPSELIDRVLAWSGIESIEVQPDTPVIEPLG